MKNKTKHLASVCVLIAFTIFAVSSRVNKIHYGAFNYYNKVEDQSANYLEKNDGSRIYGDKITWKSGLFGNSIKIDEQKFKLAEVRGYLQNGTFYGRLGKDY